MILGVSGLQRRGQGRGRALPRGAQLLRALALGRDPRRAAREGPRRDARAHDRDRPRDPRARTAPAASPSAWRRRLLPDRNYVIDSVRHPGGGRGAARAHRPLPADLGGRRRERAPGAHPRPRPRRRSDDARRAARLRSPRARQRRSRRRSSCSPCSSLADVTLRNDGELPALHEAIQHVLERSFFFERPSWDEYFMAIARVVASRSNCVKRKVAAVITLDRRIISTGYNGTPRGVRNCNEGGCPRCNSFARRRHPARRMPVQPRRGERHHAGRLPRRRRPRRHALHHLLSLPDLHQDDHQLRHRGGRLQRGLPAGGRLAVAAARGGGEGAAGGAGGVGSRRESCADSAAEPLRPDPTLDVDSFGSPHRGPAVHGFVSLASEFAPILRVECRPAIGASQAPADAGVRMGVLAFGEFEADPDRFELRRAGTRVEIPAKSFDVLLYLIRHRERVVSKRELVEKVWQAQALSTSAVPTAVLGLRRALGDEADSARHVANVRGRGYRFVAEVREVASQGVRTLPQGGWMRREHKIESVVSWAAEPNWPRSEPPSTRAARTPQIVLLSGEAGIGKTRTAEEFSIRARARDGTVLVGRCREGEGAPAFWPWIQIVRSLLEQTETVARERHIRRLAPVLAQMVPEVASLLPGPRCAAAAGARARALSTVRHGYSTVATSRARAAAPRRPRRPAPR